MLKNYAQFLRDGAGRGVAAEKGFCEQFMSFDGEKIAFHENANYNISKSRAETSITWRGTNRFSAVVNSSSKTVFPVAYYPGWKATLTGKTSDGKPATVSSRVYESEGLFLTLDVPDSNVWTAEFQFSPKSVYIGALISLGGWLTLFFVVIIKNRAVLGRLFSKKS